MRSKTLKWIVLTATLLIIVIVGVQLYWLNKIYSLEQKTFNMNVVKSIRGLYEDVDLVDSPVNHLQDYIEHPSPDYFLFRTGAHYNKDSLIWYLKDELNDFDVLTDAHIGFYDSGKRKYVSREYSNRCCRPLRSCCHSISRIRKAASLSADLFSSSQQICAQPDEFLVHQQRRAVHCTDWPGH